MPKQLASISPVMTVNIYGLVSISITIGDTHESKDNFVVSDEGFSTPQTRHKGQFAWQTTGRNPILQDATETTVEFKPSYKRDTHGQRETLGLSPQELEKPRARARGVYNENYRPQPVQDWVPSIKKVNLDQNRNESADSESRRQLHTVSNVRRNPNPIVDGDERGVFVPRPRQEPQISDQYKKLNEKRFCLPAERPTTTHIGGRRGVDESTNEDDFGRSSRNPATFTEKNRGHELKSLIGYEFSSTFKDEGVAGKINQVPKEMRNPDSREAGINYFGKKRTNFERIY
eukprot:TRINITY_DN2285_c0_g1_i3.p1 TRINITY_DN2285_c0_g1~~TRINITY_DN2285_c0_g1_i3.p1  ORF type:complete len:288 (+),score=61.96 TRINITY_DN2285_c0_g1_i3:320-1183(+)